MAAWSSVASASRADCDSPGPRSGSRSPCGSAWRRTSPSARCISSSKSPACSGHSAIPMVASDSRISPCRVNGRCSARRTACATFAASSQSATVGSSSANSSPPRRAQRRARGRGIGQPRRDGSQELVAAEVPERVVDLLEVVEVEQQQADLSAPPWLGQDRVVGAVAKEHPVGQPGEGVVAGEVLVVLLLPAQHAGLVSERSPGPEGEGERNREAGDQDDPADGHRCRDAQRALRRAGGPDDDPALAFGKGDTDDPRAREPPGRLANLAVVDRVQHAPRRGDHLDFRDPRGGCCGQCLVDRRDAAGVTRRCPAVWT